jgi:Na+/H+ antiporter NhaD/arsenite permease-like protein
MTPALLYLQAHACEIGISSPSGFYYVTGALSSFLDNTPTAVAFHTLALEFSAGCTDLVGGVREAYLVAISIGAVFFGAMTYIGNGPNFMVKSIAEQDGVEMPGFFGYIARFSIPVLLPVYIVIQLLFVS